MAHLFNAETTFYIVNSASNASQSYSVFWKEPAILAGAHCPNDQTEESALASQHPTPARHQTISDAAAMEADSIDAVALTPPPQRNKMELKQNRSDPGRRVTNLQGSRQKTHCPCAAFTVRAYGVETATKAANFTEAAATALASEAAAQGQAQSDRSSSKPRYAIASGSGTNQVASHFVMVRHVTGLVCAPAGSPRPARHSANIY